MNPIDFKLRTFLSSLSYYIEQLENHKLAPVSQKTIDVIKEEIENFKLELDPFLVFRRGRGVQSVPASIRHVLIVDDNDINLLVLRSVLDNLEISTESAKSAQDALSIIKTATPFDCFFLDIKMPEIDGIELAKKIRKIPTYANTPIIAVTASSDDATHRQTEDAGFNGYILKPVSKAAILLAISKL